MEPNERDNTQEEKQPAGNGKERLYDKIPVTYRQVDVFVKVMIAVTAIVLIAGIVAGTRG